MTTDGTDDPQEQPPTPAGAEAGAPPAAGWPDDPAVDAGFAAAYDGASPAEPSGAGSGGERPDDLETPDELAPVVPAPAAVPAPRRVRPARPAASTDQLSPLRALAGAAVSVAGVALGIGTLLWVTDDPQDSVGPVVQVPIAQERQEPAAVEPTADATPAVSPTALPGAAVEAPAVGPSIPPPSPTALPTSAAARVPVTVLNNSTVPGLADRGAARFREAGWSVTATGNLRGRIRATTVYYAPGQEAAARAFARDFPGVQRVLPRIEGLPSRGMTVVLTRDYPA